ncbi:MAG: hypothetical protein K9M99_13000 [Candidatus Cloacimonetes bacterium]|nr:hypothetical protein [Candidatus Cloacimonadota bacterium]
MKNMWIIIITGAFLLSSCSENTSGSRYPESSYYVSCVLEAQSYVDADKAVKLGSTMDIENARWDLLPVSTAQVTITEFSPAGLQTAIVELVWNDEARGYIDEDHEMLIRPEYCYHLQIVTIDGKLIEADTSVPMAINVLGDSQCNPAPAWAFDEPADDWLSLPADIADSQHPVQIVTQNDEEFNLYTEFWCYEDYTEAEYIYPEDDQNFPADDEEYMGSSQQYPRRSMSFYMYQPENRLVNYNSYQGQMKFYGRTRMEVYSIDDNYINYLYKSEGYMSGGIKGGIGVFGSRCGRKLYTRVVK